MIVTRTRFPSDRNSLRCWFFSVRSPTSMRSRYFISFISTVTCFFLASFCRFICSYWKVPVRADEAAEGSQEETGHSRDEGNEVPAAHRRWRSDREEPAPQG